MHSFRSSHCFLLSFRSSFAFLMVCFSVFFWSFLCRLSCCSYAEQGSIFYVNQVLPRTISALKYVNKKTNNQPPHSLTPFVPLCPSFSNCHQERLSHWVTANGVNGVIDFTTYGSYLNLGNSCCGLRSAVCGLRFKVFK